MAMRGRSRESHPVSERSHARGTQLRQAAPNWAAWLRQHARPIAPMVAGATKLRMSLIAAHAALGSRIWLESQAQISERR